MRDQTSPVTFPAVVYFNADVSAWPQEALKVLGMRFPSAEQMICRASAKRGHVEPPGWFLDSTGRFIEFRPVGQKNAWLKPLSWLVQFVETEFALSPPRQITCGELIELLKPIKDRFKEAPVARDLRSFLRRFPGDTVVNAEILQQWPL